jgi:hypothetical protein
VLLAATLGALAVGGLAGCGADEGRTALAIRSTAWNGRGELVVTLECAEDHEVDVAPTAGVDGIPLVTAWGQPALGRCATRFVVPVAPGVDRVEDAATGMVVDLPPRP